MNTSPLQEFIQSFGATFNPPTPYRGEDGGRWLISGVWSEHMRAWLKRYYSVQFEFPAGDGLRLDAALYYNRKPSAPMDIALEWEWDQNKVAKDFARGDFRKVLEVDARSGLAIVQTWAISKKNREQADSIFGQIVDSLTVGRPDSRPVGLIEVRRTANTPNQVEFQCITHDLKSGSSNLLNKWGYSEAG